MGELAVWGTVRRHQGKNNRTRTLRGKEGNGDSYIGLPPWAILRVWLLLEGLSWGVLSSGLSFRKLTGPWC